MSDARFGSMTVDGFLEGMASKDPTPGGGAAAAVAAATGTALIAMVGRLTLGKPGFEDLDERMRALVDRADGARGELLALGDRDAEAFEAVMAAFQMPKSTDVERASRAEVIQVGLPSRRCRSARTSRRCGESGRDSSATLDRPRRDRPRLRLTGR